MKFKSRISNPMLLVKGILTLTFSAFLGSIMAINYTSVLITNITFLADPIMKNAYASGSPFTLAQVMAIFGAFGLAAGFSDRVEEKLKGSMRRVAILHFVSALCFCLLGLLLPAIPHLKEGTVSFWIIAASVAITIVGSALSFSWGTIEWLSNIPRILGNNESQERGRQWSKP